MRTQGRFEQKLSNTDGRIVLGTSDFESVGAAITGVVRNAKGDLSKNVPAATAAIFMANLSKILYRTGQLPFLQQQFGTAASVAGPTAVAGTGDPDGVIGPPPLLGNQMGTQPGGTLTSFVPKGIRINDITLKYLITGAALTTHTIGLSKTLFANNAALVVTDILANAANGLATATQANPYVTKISINSPTFSVSDLTDLIIELDATTQGGGTYRLYGADLHVNFNFN